MCLGHTLLSGEPHPALEHTRVTSAAQMSPAALLESQLPPAPTSPRLLFVLSSSNNQNGS